MTEIVSTRIPDDIARDLKEIEKEEKTDRATLIRKLLARAIEQWKIERALVLYREGKVTLWKAADIAGTSIWEMMDTIKERNIPIQYTFKDFKEDFEAALKEK